MYLQLGIIEIKIKALVVFSASSISIRQELRRQSHTTI